MSRSKVTLDYKNTNYLNTTNHSKIRILERCNEVTHIRNAEEKADFWPVSNPEECSLDGKLVYCKELEILGAVDGKKLCTVVSQSNDKFEFNGKNFERKTQRNNEPNFEIDERVVKEVEDRKFER